LAEATSYYYEIVTSGPGGKLRPHPRQPTSPPILLPRNLYRDGTVAYANRPGLDEQQPGRDKLHRSARRQWRGIRDDYDTCRYGQPAIPTPDAPTGSAILIAWQALTGSAGSSFSAVITMTTLPTGPSAVSATSNGTSVTLTWTNNSAGATSFDVERSANNGGVMGNDRHGHARWIAHITYTDTMPGQGGHTPIAWPR